MRLAKTALSVALLVLAASGMSCTNGTDQDKPVDVSALPQEVRDALGRAARLYKEPLEGARWSKAHLLGDSDHALYQVQGKNGRGNKIELEVTRPGRIIEVEEHGIPFGEVPNVVMEALKSKRPNFAPTRIEAIYQGELTRPVCYGFEGPDTAGKEIEVYISADGKSFLN